MTNKKKQKTFQKSKLILPIIVFAVLFLVIGIGMSYFKKSLYTVMKVPEFALTDQNSMKITNKRGGR